MVAPSISAALSGSTKPLALDLSAARIPDSTASRSASVGSAMPSHAKKLGAVGASHLKKYWRL
jgi:hypothetical protein